MIDGGLEQLAEGWIAEYRARVKVSNILAIRINTFTYLFDLASAIGPDGVVLQEDRVVAAYGRSTGPRSLREPSRMAAYIGPTGQVFGEDYDKGHFIAHSMGGDVADSLNWFPQLREVNRGWSSEGVAYRAAERFCAAHHGTFYFARPEYDDLTARPTRLEAGLWHDGQLKALWYPNRKGGVRP